MTKLQHFLMASVLIAGANASAVEAYRFIVSATGLKSTCKVNSTTEKTYLKLFIPVDAGKAATDTVQVKVHACLLNDFFTSNFSLKMPLKAWSEKGSGTITIPASIMKAKFGVTGAGTLTAEVVDQNSMSAAGFSVGKHYPLQALTIQMPGYGSLSAKLQRVQTE